MLRFGKARRFSGKVAYLAAGAQVKLFPQHSLQQRQGRSFPNWLYGVGQPSAQGQTSFFAPRCKKTIVPNFSKTGRQDVKQKPADKFTGVQRHQLFLIAMGVIPPAERNPSVFQRENSVVGNRNTMGIPAQIGNHHTRVIKRWLAIDHPFLPVTGIEQIFIYCRKPCS